MQHGIAKKTASKVRLLGYTALEKPWAQPVLRQQLNRRTRPRYVRIRSTGEVLGYVVAADGASTMIPIPIYTCRRRRSTANGIARVRGTRGEVLWQRSARGRWHRVYP